MVPKTLTLFLTLTLAHAPEWLEAGSHREKVVAREVDARAW